MILFNLLLQLEGQLIYTEAQARVRDTACKIPLERVRDPNLWRALRHLQVIGIAALPRDQLDRVSSLNLVSAYRQKLEARSKFDF